MFYSQDILQKRGGKFGIIWVAATRGVQLSRREYTSVKIKRTCEEIINYITQQMPGKDGLRPRFSLYLSSQLMFGVCRVFRKQHEYLSGDVTSLWLSCTSCKIASANIDLQIKKSYETNIPSPLARATWFSELDFGNIRDHSDIQIQDLPDMQFWTYEEGLYDSSSSPEAMANRPAIPLPATPDLVHVAVRNSPLQVPNKAITLRESAEHMPRGRDMEIPGEQDLPPLNSEFYEDMQIGAEDLLSSSLEGPDVHAPTRVSAEDSSIQKSTDQTHTDPLLPPPPITGDALDLEQIQQVLPPTDETPAVFIDPEQLGVHDRPQTQPPPSPGVTPVPHHKESRTPKRKRIRMQLLPYEEPEEEGPTRRKRARRCLLVIDASIQIPHRQFREQLVKGQQTCRGGIELVDTEKTRLQDMFKIPYTNAIKEKPRFRRLWDRNLRTRHVTTDEKDKDSAWTVPTDTSSSDSNSPRLELLAISASDEDMHAPMAPAADQTVVESAVEAIREASVSHIELPRDASQSHLLDTTGLATVTPHPNTSSLSRSRDGSFLTSFDAESAQKAHRRFSDSLHESVQQEPTMESYIEEFPLYQIPEDLEMQALHMETPAPPPTEPQVLPQDTRGSPEAQQQRSPKPRPMQVPGYDERELQVNDDAYPSVHHKLMKSIQKHTKNGRVARFEEVCPLVVIRFQAALHFSALLDICALRKVTADQEMPFGHIFIQRGPKW